MPFPPRTATTDALIRAIHAELVHQGVGLGGNNRMMICVVTSGNAPGQTNEVHVGFSGGVAGGGVRAALANIAAQPLFAAFNTTILAFGGAAQLAAAPGGPIAAQAGHFQVAHQRHCAEPRALLAAVAAGNRPNGMSTMWWGNNANPYPHPDGGPPPGVGGATIFAAPCQICSANEAWIMTLTGAARERATGVPGRSAEAPF